jgi:hypothetical protein
MWALWIHTRSTHHFPRKKRHSTLMEIRVCVWVWCTKYLQRSGKFEHHMKSAPSTSYSSSSSRMRGFLAVTTPVGRNNGAREIWTFEFQLYVICGVWNDGCGWRIFHSTGRGALSWGFYWNLITKMQLFGCLRECARSIHLSALYVHLNFQVSSSSSSSSMNS